jgi:hypothetical protein
MPDAPKFPTDWPPNCPPDDPLSPPTEVFRVVRKFPDPPDSQFRSLSEKNDPRGGCPCQRCGLSVLQDLEGALHIRRAVKPLGKVIIKATLHAKHGRTKPTPGLVQSHATWWPAIGVDRIEMFSLVEA